MIGLKDKHKSNYFFSYACDYIVLLKLCGYTCRAAHTLSTLASTKDPVSPSSEAGTAEVSPHPLGIYVTLGSRTQVLTLALQAR